MKKSNQPVILGKIDSACVVAMDYHMSNGCAGCLEFVALFPGATRQFAIVQFHCLLCSEVIETLCERG